MFYQLAKIFTFGILVFFTARVHAQIQDQFWGTAKDVIFSTDQNGSNLAIKKRFKTTNPGGFPNYTRLTEVAGKLYGVTEEGGVNDAGVLFEYDPVANQYTKQIDFILTGTSGHHPQGSLLAASDGKLYGVTTGGGFNGLLFSFDPVSKLYDEKVLFGSSDGFEPIGDLTQVSSGKIYGITKRGGASDKGTIFEYDPIENILKKVAEFNGANGANPIGNLLLSTGAKLCGLTSRGGVTDNGVLFEFDPALGTISKKFDFSDKQGTRPIGGLTEVDGKFYGTTSTGGNSVGGVLFEYVASTNSYTVRFDFASTNAYTPSGFLAKSNGKLYGTTRGSGDGYIFEFDLASGVGTIKKGFGFFDGARPVGGLMRASNGKLYGLTSWGGGGEEGVLYEYDPGANAIIKKVDFDYPGDGAGSGSGVTRSTKNQKVYGITLKGGANGYGVIYEFDPVQSAFEKKVDIPYLMDLNGFLVEGNDKKLYTTVIERSGNHAIFAYDVDNNSFQKVLDLTGMLYKVRAGFVNASNGKLYAMTLGTTLLEFDPVTKTKREIYLLGPKTNVTSVGVFVELDGKLFGTTNDSFYEYDLVTDQLTRKVSISGCTGSLAVVNQKIYGLTETGGANSAGTIFEFDPVANAVTKKFDFTTATGAFPKGGLLEGPDGKLYGTATSGGANGQGVVFRYDPTTGVHQKTHDFKSPKGQNPTGNLILVKGVKADQSITFTSLTDRTMKDAPVTLSATSTSGLPVVFSSASDKVNINGNQMTLMKPGWVTVSASQPGNNNFGPAETLENSFCIKPVKPVISVTENTYTTALLTSSNPIGNQWYIDNAIILNGTRPTYRISASATYTVRTRVDFCFSELSMPFSYVVVGGIDEEVAEVDPLIFPNPASNQFKVDLKSFGVNKTVQIEIIDMKGRKLEQRSSQGKSIETFSSSEYSPGFYLVKFICEGRVSYKKLVKI